MTEPFTTFELNEWCKTQDFSKIERQLAAAKRRRENQKTVVVLATLENLYKYLKEGKYELARVLFRRLDDYMREAYGWMWWRNSHPPRPLNKAHLAHLYWGASRVLTGSGRPRPEGDGDWKKLNREFRNPMLKRRNMAGAA